jgi:hypothetical protein
MSLLATATNDTAPEANAWYQARVPSTPEIEKVGGELATRIRRALVARQYSGNAGSSGVAELRGTLVVPHHGRIKEDINRTIRAVFPPTIPTPALSLQPLQEWEGYVTEVRGDLFTARLTDLSAARKIEEESAEFPIDDLSDDDQKLLHIGAIFRWIIGYQRSSDGTKRRVSQVTFRRLPAWTSKDLNHARARATEFVDQIIWD